MQPPAEIPFPAPFTRNAIVVDVHDGDTIDVVVDRGDRQYDGTPENPVAYRLSGLNLRELKDPGGPEARDRVAELLPPGTRVVLATIKPDKYGGRKDALVRTEDCPNVTELLIAEGWAARWNGRGPKPVPPWPRVTP